MLDKSATPTNDLLKSQMNVEESQNKEESSELKVMIPIGGGLHMVGNNEKGYCVVMGKSRVTEWFKTIDELQTYIGDLTYENREFIVRVIATMIGINETEKIGNK